MFVCFNQKSILNPIPSTVLLPQKLWNIKTGAYNSNNLHLGSFPLN